MGGKHNQYAFKMAISLENPTLVFTGAILLRIGMFFYGLWQDTNSAIKYTDIDYYVFTDAARNVHRGLSPYQRATYRYTPILALILSPTVWPGYWFSFGKALFATGDIFTGLLILWILRHSKQFTVGRATKYASIWLLNPMVATISTRGSSEGLLALIIMLMLWAAVRGNSALAGALLGLSVHLKMYPFIYAFSLFWAISPGPSQLETLHLPRTGKQVLEDTFALITPGRIRLVLCSLLTFTTLNIVMYLRCVQTSNYLLLLLNIDQIWL